MIPLFYPSYNGKDIRKRMKKLFPKDMSNRWLGEGPLTKELEEKFGKKFDYKYCLSTNSGSSALELAYHLLDLKAGDEVITPILTCTATNIPLLRRGVKIVFADIRGQNLTINPEEINKKITKKTKAIIGVTLGGMPIDEVLFYIAKAYKIPVVIDAAQSLGVSEKYGDYICYSFQAIKHFTSGDGGMLVLRNKEDYKRAKKLRWFGIDREAKERANWQPYKKREMTMNIEEPGYKYQMSDVAATIAISGLKYSDKWLAHRKEIGDYYRTNLICPVILGRSYWLAGIIVDNRDEVAKKLEEAGIETNIAHLRNDIFTAFGGQRIKNLDVMNDIEDEYLYIPLNTYMTMKDARYIVKTLNNII